MILGQKHLGHHQASGISLRLMGRFLLVIWMTVWLQGSVHLHKLCLPWERHCLIFGGTM